MSAESSIALEEVMAPRLGSVDPSAFPGEEFDLYSIPAFDRGEPEVLEGSEIGSAKQIVQPGDVLLSRIVPHIRRAWVVGGQRGRRIIASGEWIVFRSGSVEPGYLRHVLVGDPFHAEFLRTVSGVGGSLLRARPAYVGKIRIPLPHLAEQRRIAEVLDKVDALRAKRRVGRAQLGSLTQSIFLDMFGDPATNPKGWPVRTLAELGARFRYGTSSKSASVGKPALRIPNVVGGSLDLASLKLVPVSDAELERLRLRDGDLLFVRTNGNPDFVGRCAVFERRAVASSGFSPDQYVFASYLIRARVPHDAVLPVVLREFLLCAAGRRLLRSRCKTSAGQYNLNTTSLGTIPVMVPSIDLQRRFVDRVEATDRLRSVHAAALAELDALFASLQHRAFRGELPARSGCGGSVT